jgi:hypothetical protein
MVIVLPAERVPDQSAQTRFLHHLLRASSLRRPATGIAPASIRQVAPARAIVSIVR